MIDAVKLTLRITTDAFDDELMMLINSCKIDLNLAGVNIINEDDDRIRNAICLYCKANFGYRDDSQKFQNAYISLRDSMALSSKYKEINNE
ncbi:MAG: head-tail connector protein [Ruminococcus sp.]|nr:head-tail connector protein [Ruminococcus sp.]